MFKWLIAKPPAIGSKWYLDDEDPFDTLDVTIHAIKRGWVQYECKGTGLMLTRSIRSFRILYREY